MIKYYNKLITSLSEINESPTLLIHSLRGCNLKCYNCINYDELIVKKHEDYYDINYITKYLKLNSYLFEYIVLSGGEFLLNDIDDIIKDIKLIKGVTNTPIILYTNGTFPLKLKTLLEDKTIDGVHVDMKLPYHYLESNTDKDIIKEILGINATEKTLQDILLSIEYAVKFDKGLNQIRTIKYPQICETVLEDCKTHIDTLNSKYKKNTPYRINEFIWAED